MNLVQDWKSLEDYPQFCRYGAHQVNEAVDGREIHVLVERFGYVTVLADSKDQLLSRILAFIDTEVCFQTGWSRPATSAS